VIVLETSGAGWSANSGDAMHPGTFQGSAGDGLGDTDVLASPAPYSGSGTSSSPSNYDHNSLIGEHFATSWPVTGGTVTLPMRTLTAHTSTTYPQTAQWYYGASAGVGPYTASIHAQPYDFHQTQVVDNGNGTLTFTYFWLSTDGILGDLDPDCVVHEYVTYPGNGSYYVPPSPFTVTAPGLPNPTITPTPKIPGSDGVLTDNQLSPGVVQPYKVQNFSGT
jgi:hypothetical protein